MGAYVVGCVDCGEGALEAAHLLGACVCLAAKVSAEQVVIAVFDCCQLVVFRGELVCVVAEECALGRRVVLKMLPPELAATVSVARFALAWGTSASRWSLFGGAIVEPTSVELV